MAHFAQIEYNKVVQVLVVGNADINNLPFPESEAVGIAFLDKLIPGKQWKQTSYNNNFRFKYAGIGDTFYPECGDSGGFASPPEFEYFIFNTNSCIWIPPIPYPTDGNDYYWSDVERNWIKVPTLTVVG